MNFLNTYFADRLAGLHADRAARAERTKLHDELASYRTEAERAELNAILSRHSSEEIALLEEKSGWRAA